MGSIQLYNSLTRRKEELTPLTAGRIGMYVCGVTPYDDCHIGHVLGPVVFDTIARWLRSRGLDVHFVVNITDIDDKIINRAQERNETWESLSQRYTRQYLELLKQLHVITISEHPHCTAYIPQMVAYIAELISAGRAYATADGVYYDVVKQPDYGKLSGRRLDEMISGARVDRDQALHHPADFALWKLAKPGEPSWPSPWGAGRPGWHIECSVMSHACLGGHFDIHGGGDDLKFPHHENEIAQGEAHGDRYAQVWMHNGLIQYDGVKVGKSDPRMQDPAFAIRFQALHLLTTHGAATIRFIALQGHYRRPSDFAESAIQAAHTALTKLHRQLGPLLDEEAAAPLIDADGLAELLARPLPEALQKHVLGFVAAMDDDFGSGTALAHLFSLFTEARRCTGAEGLAALRAGRDLGRILGLFQVGDGRHTVQEAAAVPQRLSTLMVLVLELRQEARAQRDFARSDQIRNHLAPCGVAIKDAKGSASWELQGDAVAAEAAAVGLLESLAAGSQAAGDSATALRIRSSLVAP